MGWATFWAIFSQTHRVTLVAKQSAQIDFLTSITFKTKKPVLPTRVQGCQIFLGPNIPKRKK
jgi:hypothetical protein